MQKLIVHFIHVRKTGGTAIKEALKDVSETQRYKLKLHRHAKKLRDIPYGEKVFFFLRDPVSRFVSGFNSRLRQGRPRYNYPWNENEKIAFACFPTANSLAENLFQKSQAIDPQWAMEKIRHVNSTYAEWFDSIEYLNSRKEDILFIGFQETLEQDFSIIKKQLGLPENITLPQDDFLSHKTPDNFNVSLSEQAMQNLREWYATDYDFLNFCAELTM
jgi:hypothetical protein